MTPTEVTQDNKVDTNIKITNTMLDIYPGNTPRGPLSNGTNAHGYGAKQIQSNMSLQMNSGFVMMVR